LMTPLLIFMGIPPVYAVANEANNILASSSSGALTHWFKKTLDVKIGWLIVIGGLVGTFIGILTFSYFKGIGKIDIVIALAYMYVLAIIGSFMLKDGLKELDIFKKKFFIKKKLHTHYWIHGLPFRMRFKTSKVYESALVPLILGIVVGFVSAIMGVGGAFLMVPDIYNWNANKTCSWHLIICNYICNRICYNFSCLHLSNDRSNACFNINYRIHSWGSCRSKIWTKTSSVAT
jgi:uncharacterized membrane protein YfcA